MGCCGGNRARAMMPAQPVPTPRAGLEFSTPTPRVQFEYAGQTALTVFGPVTATRYRFERSGVRIEVDGRDAGYLAGVPNLRRVSP